MHASRVDKDTPRLGADLRDAGDVVQACILELCHILVPEVTRRRACACVDVSTPARGWARARSPFPPGVQHRQARSVQNAARCASEFTGLPLPGKLRSLRGLRIVMAVAGAGQFPPEAGAPFDEFRQLDACVSFALCKLRLCARAVEGYNHSVVEEFQVVGAVHLDLFPELGQVAFDSAFAILDGNIEADDATERARG